MTQKPTYAELEKRVQELEPLVGEIFRKEPPVKDPSIQGPSSFPKETNLQNIDLEEILAENSAEVIWQVDLSGRVAYVSPTVTKQMGYTPEEAANLHFKSLISESTVEGAERAFSKAVSGRTFQLIELEGKRKDGSIIPLEISVTPIISNDTVVGAQGIARDISDRRNSERKERETAQRLRLALECADQGIWEWNFETGMVAFDEIALGMLNHDLNTPPRKSEWWFDQIHPEDRPQMEKAFEKYLAGESDRYRMEFRIRKAI